VAPCLLLNNRMASNVNALLILSLPAALAAAACGADLDSSRVALVQYDSCAELESDLKDRARDELSALLEGFGQWGGGGLDDAAPEAGDASSDGDGGGRTEGEDFSGTNNQEDGVDEADLVKTDGYRIYLVDGSGLHVFGVPEFGQLVEGELVSIEGSPTELLLDAEHQRAAVFSMVTATDLPVEHPLRDEVGQSDDAAPWYWRSQQLSKITILDLADPDAPTVEREIWLEGYYQTARDTDGAVQVVANGHIFMPGLDNYWEYMWDSNGNQRDVGVVKMMANARIAAASLEELIPRIYTRTPDGTLTVGSLAGDACASFYYPTNSVGRGTTSIVSLDLASDDLAVDADTIVANWATVYASDDRLYLAEAAWDWWYAYRSRDPGELFTPSTNLHAFDIGQAGTAAYIGSGRIEGIVNDQFSLDEEDGLLRVAATTSPWRIWSEWTQDLPNPQPESHVYVLEETATGLETVGHVGGIAPGETIQSARFDGDRGYVVTFQQIDPLFTIDLTDPRSPALVGELEVFGFSSYLHPIADGRLLAIGVGGDANGANWRTQVSMFDVSDLSSPQLIDSDELVTEGWSYSEAQHEHKAFQYFEPVGLLAIPMSGYVQTNVGGEYGYEWTSRLELIEVNEDGLASHGAIDQSSYYGRDWWAPASIRRTIFMGDFIYAIGARAITVHRTSDLEEVAASELPATPEPYWWW
jgi:hypothetical protein